MLRRSLICSFALLATSLVGCDLDNGETPDLGESTDPSSGVRVRGATQTVPGKGPLGRGSPQFVPSQCLATSTPANGAERVDIVARPTITWNSAIGRSSAAGRVRLVDLSTGAEVAATQTWLNDRTLQLDPDGSLWFFKSYEVQIDSGISAAGDVPCVSLRASFSTRNVLESPADLRPAGISSSASIGSYFFAIGREHRNLQVWDFSGTPELLTEAAVAADPNAIAALGDRLYVAAGSSGLVILDAQNPLTLTVVGTVETAGSALDVVAWVDAGQTYVAIADLDGVRILQATNPAAIVEVGSFGIGDADPSTSLAYEGGLLAVGRGAGGISLVDVSTPSAPLALANHDLGGYPARDVALSSGVLYVARSFYGIASFDVSDPADLVEVGLVHAFDGRDCSDDCVDDLGGLTVDGDLLFASTGRRGALRVGLDGAGGMTDLGVLDVAGPGWTTTVLGGRLVVGGEAGPTVFDRSAPAGSSPQSFDPDGHGAARGVMALGGALHAAANSRGLQTFALDEPLSPELVLRTATAGADLDLGPMFLASAGETLVLADGRSGMRLFDASDAEAPSALGFVGATDRIAGLRVDGSLAVACDDNRGVLVVDVANPAAPVVRSLLAFDPPYSDQCRDVEVSGSVAWIAASNSLRIVDLTDPAAPSWNGAVPLAEGEGLGSLAKLGHTVFATSFVQPTKARHLYAFDVSSPTQPVVGYRSEVLLGASGLFATGDVLFLGAGTSGLAIYDVRDPYAPQLEGTAAVTGAAGNMAYAGNTLYSAEGLAGVRAFDVGVLP